jgi:hypothetical protein
MDYDAVSVIELCGIAGLVFGFLCICMLWIGVRVGRSEFRSKGFLRTPSGVHWFRFLIWKQYEAFDKPMTRLFFGYAYFCLMVIIVIATAIVVLLASDLLLNRF